MKWKAAERGRSEGEASGVERWRFDVSKAAALEGAVRVRFEESSRALVVGAEAWRSDRRLALCPVRASSPLGFEALSRWAREAL